MLLTYVIVQCAVGIQNATDDDDNDDLFIYIVYLYYISAAAAWVLCSAWKSQRSTAASVARWQWCSSTDLQHHWRGVALRRKYHNYKGWQSHCGACRRMGLFPSKLRQRHSVRLLRFVASYHLGVILLIFLSTSLRCICWVFFHFCLCDINNICCWLWWWRWWWC